MEDGEDHNIQAKRDCAAKKQNGGRKISRAFREKKAIKW